LPPGIFLDSDLGGDGGVYNEEFLAIDLRPEDLSSG
jgi:hypothetical protein